MKKIVIVEDKPWTTGKAVSLLENKTEIRIIYYPNSFGDNAEKDKLLNNLKKETNVKIDTVINQEEFVKKMEEWYEKPDVVFFMDYDLKGDGTLPPEERINFRYAKLKEYGEGQNEDSRKIWFYTTSGVVNLEVIAHNFPEKVLHVDNYTDGQLTWDADEVSQIIR